MTHATRTLALTLALALSLGCKDTTPKPEAAPAPLKSVVTTAPPEQPAPSAVPVSVPPVAKAASAAATGRLRIRYGTAETADHKEITQLLRRAGVFEDLAKTLTESLKFRHDITVELGPCGQVNAFYDNELHLISMCYELLEDFAVRFAEESDDDDDVETGVHGAFLFTFFHELGHALVHHFDLPITGKEEDAVDQLATVILLSGGEEGEALAFAGAESFLMEAADADPDDLAYWGEHSLSKQRFYNILCWIYGSDPDAFEGLIEAGALPEDRAVICPDEYKRLAMSWSKLLAPHERTAK